MHISARNAHRLGTRSASQADVFYTVSGLRDAGSGLLGLNSPSLTSPSLLLLLLDGLGQRVALLGCAGCGMEVAAEQCTDGVYESAGVTQRLAVSECEQSHLRVAQQTEPVQQLTRRRNKSGADTALGGGCASGVKVVGLGGCRCGGG